MGNDYTERHVGLGVGLVSTAMLMTETILTRIFSVTVGFHFAFLAISVALFGIGTSALLVHLLQHRLAPERTDALLVKGSVALALAIVVCDLVFLFVSPEVRGRSSMMYVSPTGLPYMTLAFVVSSLPFLAGGFVVALAITRHAGRIHSLYFFDLAGAAAGCLLVIPALELAGAPVALVLVAALAALGGLAFVPSGSRRSAPALFWAPVLVAAAIVGLAAVDPALGLLRVRRAKGFDLTVSRPELVKWNSFSMVTVLGKTDAQWHGFRGWGMSRHYRGQPPEQKMLVIDMGAATPLVRYEEGRELKRFVLSDISAFGYLVRRQEARRVCVIGAGGGRDVLSALAAGAEHVTAVEINPIIVDDVVRGRFREFSGGLYDRDDVTAVVDDGRAFMRSTDQRFDLIQISMIDTSAATAAGAYSLTEHNLYTVEAFRDYLDNLAPGGLLTVSSISAPVVNAGARLVTIAWEALEQIGADPRQSIAVVSTAWGGPLDLKRPVVMRNTLVKREPFTDDELERMGRISQRLGFHRTHLPGVPARPGARGVPTLFDPDDRRPLAARVADWPLDVTPTTDDRPFFFYQNRLADARRILGLEPRDRGGPMGTGLPLLLRVALVAAGMALVFLLLPLVLARRQLRAGGGGAAWDLAYVACLGLGFMFVEIALLQRFTLYLGRPTATLAVVLFVLLGAGAVGSRMFGRLVPDDRRRRALALIIGVLVLLIVLFWQTGLGVALFDTAAGWPFPARAAAAGAVLVPFGLLLGVPLPSGLRAVSGRAAGRVPWLWAINSATSVLGSVSATLVSLHSGITTTLWVGAALYALALALSLRVSRAPDC